MSVRYFRPVLFGLLGVIVGCNEQGTKPEVSIQEAGNPNFFRLTNSPGERLDASMVDLGTSRVVFWTELVGTKYVIRFQSFNASWAPTGSAITLIDTWGHQWSPFAYKANNKTYLAYYYADTSLTGTGDRDIKLLEYSGNYQAVINTIQVTSDPANSSCTNLPPPADPGLGGCSNDSSPTLVYNPTSSTMTVLYNFGYYRPVGYPSTGGYQDKDIIAKEYGSGWGTPTTRRLTPLSVLDQTNTLKDAYATLPHAVFHDGHYYVSYTYGYPQSQIAIKKYTSAWVEVEQKFISFPYHFDSTYRSVLSVVGGQLFVAFGTLESPQDIWVWKLNSSLQPIKELRLHDYLVATLTPSSFLQYNHLYVPFLFTNPAGNELSLGFTASISGTQQDFFALKLPTNFVDSTTGVWPVSPVIH